MNLRPGEHYDRYLIQSLLAETRMSRVWMACDQEEKRVVALKTVRRLAENDDLVEAARFGASLQQKLCERDPRVVKVHRCGETDGYFFIDMEYVDGKDVSEIVHQRGRLAPDQAIRIALEVAEVLDNLHNFSDSVDGRAIISAVHGDLKPKNIRLTGDIDGEFAVKLLDFGTAKALSQTKPSGTRTPAWSPAYASPELLDRREMNPLSDRWALGVSLYEMVTGRVPFGAGKGIEEMEHQIRLRPAMPDLELPETPAALHAILFKLLHPEPKQRYQTAQELCADLRAYPEMPRVTGYQGETVRSSEPAPSAAADPGATRRSDPLEHTATVPMPSRRGKAPLTPQQRMTRLVCGLAMLIVVVWWAVLEGKAWNAARKLEADLAAEKVTLADARKRLQEINGVFTPKANIHRLMNTGLVAQGDALVTRFRTQPLRIADWREARSHFEQALETNPGDQAVRGRLRICEAHLRRFQGQAADNDATMLAEAEVRFREAAEKLPQSPDPWLGLAMLAIYNQKEPAKGEQALNEARNRNFNYSSDTRWVSLLADAYKNRAEVLEFEAVRIARTLPDQAQSRLDNAKEFLEKAIEWYTQIPLYGDSLREIERCREAVGRVEARLDKLQSGDTEL